MISKGRLDEFKALYEKRYGVTLDEKKTAEVAEHVLAMFRAIYRPIPKDSPLVGGQ